MLFRKDRTIVLILLIISLCQELQEAKIKMVQKTVIIVTPYQEFGELISHCLHKNLAWKVDAAFNSRTVTEAICNYQSLDYALLDMELGFEQVRESIFIIRDKFPGIEITLISKIEPPEEAEDLRPWKL